MVSGETGVPVRAGRLSALVALKEIHNFMNIKRLLVIPALGFILGWGIATGFKAMEWQILLSLVITVPIALYMGYKSVK